MAHLFAVLIDGNVHTYSDYDDIPQSFENVIRFEPEIPPEPHTEEQHHEIAQWDNKLKELMKRETR